MRFRYSTDAAYLDTGFFVDDVTVGGQAATLSSAPGNWLLTTGVQDNNWVVQVLSPCDLTPGTTSIGQEIVDNSGNYVYRFSGDEITAEGFLTSCLRGSMDTFTVVISNLPTADIQIAQSHSPSVTSEGTLLSGDHRDRRSKMVQTEVRCGPQGSRN